MLKGAPDKKELGFGSELWLKLNMDELYLNDAALRTYVESFEDCQKNFAKLNDLYEKSLGNILVLKREIESLKERN